MPHADDNGSEMKPYKTRVSTLAIVFLCVTGLWLVYTALSNSNPETGQEASNDDRGTVGRHEVSAEGRPRTTGLSPLSPATSRSSPIPPSRGERIIIRTMLPDGTSVGGVELADVSQSPPAEIGITDASGVVALSFAARDRVVLRAVGPKHVSDDVAIHAIDTRAPLDKSVTLIVRPGAFIKGFVVSPSGQAVGEDVFVAALDPNGRMGKQAIADLIGNKATSRLAVTSATGSFQLGPVEAGTSYALAAGGHGWVIRELLQGIVPGDRLVEITVEGLFGATLQLKDIATGGEIRLNHRVAYASRVQARQPGVQPLGMHAGVLLALQSTGVDLPAGRDRALFFAADAGWSEVGPFRFEASIPGYERVQEEFTASRIVGEMDSLNVFATPIAKGFGSLRLRMRNLPKGLASHRDEGTWSNRLLLAPLDSNKSSISIVLSSLSESMEFEQIPMGDYEARFTNNVFTSPPRESPGAPVRIDEFETELALDFRGSGAAALILKDALGREFDGFARMMLVIGANSSGDGYGLAQHISFRSSPYLFGPLPAGEDVEIVIQAPFSCRLLLSAPEGDTLVQTVHGE